jgi:class 3 adenylate cyclase/tetratricopeptide (TPR) repeat protein
VGCGRCGALLEAGDLFCGDCGAPVGGCPSCGKPLTPGKRFCRFCGATLFEAAPAPAVAAPALDSPPGRESAAERRVCSVLFCDVVGFTPLSESRDPEAVRELLSQYFAVARTVISRYGGVVEKFIGDAVMAVWGTPVATEGDAERAVRAALDLVAAVAELGAESGLPGLAARAGVVTGEMAVNLGAVGEGMVAGDAVNTAARVQAAADPGQVLVDGATRRLAEAAVGFADAGERALKGKAEPQRLWRAVRVLSAVGGSQRVDGLEAPLTGRDAELRTVKDLFHAAAERRVPRLVLVSGPAGVGKSRLGWEFEKYADGLKAEVWWHRGRCLSYGEGVAFWALAQIVRQRLGIAEEDPPEAAVARLAAGLDRFVPDPAEQAYAGLRLGRLLGVPFGGDGGEALSREELFAGWRLFFERLAAESPVVLLVEDGQYADAGLLDFLEHLIDWVRDLPVYVLIFARPELGQARPGFGAGRNRSTLTLDPLDAASMEALVDALVPGMPPAARAKITRQAQGIPLFAVETVRSLIDRDVVQPVEGVYRLTGDVGELAVPDSLHALLAARLDALDPDLRRLVSDAAVLGTTFPAEALIAVCGQEEAKVRATLTELVHREVLTVSADPLSPEKGSYGFAQNMLRQVTYDTLSRRDRKTRHLRVATHLRDAFPGDGEEVADVIARHYLDALEAVPDDGDAAEIRGQAVGALTRAAERAKRTGAPGLAATSYATAARLTQDQPDETEHTGQAMAGLLWEHAARAALTQADWPAVLEYADRASDRYRQESDARGAARAQTIAGEALFYWGRYTEAHQRLTATLTFLQADPDVDTLHALVRLSWCEVFAGLPGADRLTTEALTLGQALGADQGLLAQAFQIRAIYLENIGRSSEAVGYLREAVRLAEQAGDAAVLANALLNLSHSLGIIDAAAAAETARAAARHARQVGDRDILAYAAGNLAEALLILGDWDAVEEELTHAADADGLGNYEHLTRDRAWLGALRGEADIADALLAALPNLRASENPEDKAFNSQVEAFVAAARRRPEDALRHARACLAFEGIGPSWLRWAWPLAARATYDLNNADAAGELLALLDSHPPGHLPGMVQAERDLARARLGVRDGHPEAAEMFASAISGLRERSTPYHLAHGLLDYARYLDSEAAEAAVSEAREIAARLRCQPLLDRAADLTRTRPPVQA